MRHCFVNGVCCWKSSQTCSPRSSGTTVISLTSHRHQVTSAFWREVEGNSSGATLKLGLVAYRSFVLSSAVRYLLVLFCLKLVGTKAACV